VTAENLSPSSIKLRTFSVSSLRPKPGWSTAEQWTGHEAVAGARTTLRRHASARGRVCGPREPGSGRPAHSRVVAILTTVITSPAWTLNTDLEAVEEFATTTTSQPRCRAQVGTALTHRRFTVDHSEDHSEAQ
jgi:hypothetical protein